MSRIGEQTAGIGGLELGLEVAGLGQTVYQVEIEPYQRKVLARHWPDAVQYADIRKVDGRALPKVDIIAGGFPCKGFSTAGKRQAFCDPQSSLWAEMYRIISEQLPRAVVVENVAELVNSANHLRVVSDLEGLGYRVAEPLILNGADFGAPHRRMRAFIFAVRKSGKSGNVFGVKFPKPRGASPRAGDPPRALEKATRYPGLFKSERLVCLGNSVMPEMGFYVGLVLKSMLTGKKAPPMPKGRPLSGGEKYWPTPITTDAKGARRDTAREEAKLRGESWTSNTGTTLTDALWLENDRRDWGKPLNPEFVEQLMGFPRGYTLPTGPSVFDEYGEAQGGEMVERQERKQEEQPEVAAKAKGRGSIRWFI